MRPLTVTALSTLTSVGLAIITHHYSLHLNLTQTLSPATFTTLLVVALCFLGTLACIWIALSYLTLTYTQHTNTHRGALITLASRLATPYVRRILAGTIALSLAVAQPAYADDNDSAENKTPADISWGSPDLLEIAEYTDIENIALTPASPTEAPSTIHPSLDSDTNTLTSTPTTTIISDTENAPLITEPPNRSLPPPQASLPQQVYTVKSGDTLWAIAQAHLPDHSTDSDIAQACLSWAQANPSLTNPNLIYPGQTLTIP